MQIRLALLKSYFPKKWTVLQVGRYVMLQLVFETIKIISGTVNGGYLPGRPWVWGSPWVWVWGGYGDRNYVPTAALLSSALAQACSLLPLINYITHHTVLIFNLCFD